MLLAAMAAVALAQQGTVGGEMPSPTKTPAKAPRTLFFDSNGFEVSNNEFVDIRMANFHLPDRTLIKTREDGTIEFRLQKIPQEGGPMSAAAALAIDGSAAGFEAWKGKVIVLNFWFIGCPACMAEIPRLNQMRSKFEGRDDIVFAAVTADTKGKVNDFLKKNVFNYLMIADGQIYLDSFGFSGYPKNIVIGRDGKIVYWRSTIKAWDKFESVISSEAERPHQ